MGNSSVSYYEDAIHASECARPDLVALFAGSSTPSRSWRQARLGLYSVSGSWIATAAVLAMVGAALLSTVALVV